MNSEAKAENTFDAGTLAQANIAIECLENRAPEALKAVKDYFRLLFKNLRVFDFPSAGIVDYNLVYQKTEQMIRLRNEIVNVIDAIAEYCEDTEFYTELHNFFESLLLYFNYRDEGDSNKTIASDHYKLFGYELFIYTIATLLKHLRFEQLNELTQQGYYVSSRNYNGRSFDYLNYNEFAKDIYILREYCQDKRISESFARSAFLSERIFKEKFKYDDLAQADFVLCFISILNEIKSESFSYNVWSIHLHSDTRIFELFAKSKSKYFYEKLRKCLKNFSKSEIENFLKENAEKIYGEYVYTENTNLETRLGLKNLATK